MTPLSNSPRAEVDALVAEVHSDRLGWRRRSFVSLTDFDGAQVDQLISVAAALKRLDQARMPGVQWSYPRTMAMIFEKPSLRTRVSFEASMVHLRGTAIYLAPGDVGLGVRESVEDVAGVLGRWVDVVAARVFRHQTVADLAAFCTSPVINALSDLEHPLQALADVLTVREHVPATDGRPRVAYVGDGNNVLHALLIACADAGIDLVAACPPAHQPLARYVAEASARAVRSGATSIVVADPREAVAGADVVYTDVWASMGQEEEARERAVVFEPYQVNDDLLQHAKPGAIALHCLPAHRGAEITETVMQRFKQPILDQAENRLHTLKALLLMIIGL